jgi:hypothetical protein
MLPPPPPAPAPRVLDPQVPAGEPSSPLQLKIGDATITPVGFMDLTGVWRSENAGSGIGSSFGSVPYNNASTAHLSEFRFSPQNSRIGFRIDANVKGAHVIGYNEMTSWAPAVRTLSASPTARSSPHPPVLGGCPQRRDRVPGRSKLEFADPAAKASRRCRATSSTAKSWT